MPAHPVASGCPTHKCTVQYACVAHQHVYDIHLSLSNCVHIDIANQHMDEQHCDSCAPGADKAENQERHSRLSPPRLGAQSWAKK
jgi:hypothetical protein